ncbi:hypothetical protein ACGFSI_24910 [Streptomyces virginiae]|uniref:hypothetical protein n=1 Tax=Streptomyces virginiae TaxID=1961 RepID=UPI003715E9CB
MAPTSRIGAGAGHRPRPVEGRGALSGAVTRALRSVEEAFAPLLVEPVDLRQPQPPPRTPG